ncbi:MAG: inositol monophosphatase, partial [Treponema sp.]|nr:inositol monophosphatase [Treponema sp.]
FSNNLPLFGVQCSLFDNDQLVVSVIYLPFANELYSATLGGGAFLNDKRIIVNPVSLDKTVISFGDFPHSRIKDAEAQQELIKKLYPKIARIRMFGAASIDFAYVASGKTNGSILYTKNKWDIAPGILLCREAGAFVYGDNGSYSFNSRYVIAVSSQELLDCILQSI